MFDGGKSCRVDAADGRILPLPDFR